MTKEEFSELLARRWSENDLLVSLTAIHYISLEKYCTQELLNDYKSQMKTFFEVFDGGIKKFFPHLTKAQIHDFGVLFFSLINGLYPLTHLSPKQSEAMKKAIPEYSPPEFYEICAKGIYAIMYNF